LLILTTWFISKKPENQSSFSFPSSNSLYDIYWCRLLIPFFKLSNIYR